MTEVLTGDPLGWKLAEAVETAVSIGVFDGVHLGHRRVLSTLVESAESRHLTPTVLTFDPHPLEIVAPERAPRLLSTIGQRIERFAELGFQIVGVLPFDQIRRMQPSVFAEDVLAVRLAARHVAVGEDFRFGLHRGGDTETLRASGSQAGYQVEVVDLLDAEDAPISSSRIRSLLESGDVEEAATLLGRPYELRGIVVEGDGRGRSIGIPTANLAIDERMVIPFDGVYAAWAVVGDDAHRAVVNVGFRPTFGTARRTVEAHLLDGEHDLYGLQVGLVFLGRIRGERKFPDAAALVEQIRVDIESASAILVGASSPGAT